MRIAKKIPYLPVVALLFCAISGCGPKELMISFNNTTNQSLYVVLAGPGKGAGPIGVIAPAPNTVFRKILIDEGDLPHEYTWKAGEHEGKFTVTKDTRGPLNIRIPGGLSQAADLYAAQHHTSNQGTGTRSVSNSTKYRSAPARTVVINQPVVREKYIYVARKPARDTYVVRHSAPGPVLVSSRGGGYSSGGFVPVPGSSRYSSSGYGYGGTNVSFGGSWGNGFVSGTIYSDPYHLYHKHPEFVPMFHSYYPTGGYGRAPYRHHGRHPRRGWPGGMYSGFGTGVYYPHPPRRVNNIRQTLRTQQNLNLYNPPPSKPTPKTYPTYKQHLLNKGLQK